MNAQELINNIVQKSLINLDF